MPSTVKADLDDRGFVRNNLYRGFAFGDRGGLGGRHGIIAGHDVFKRKSALRPCFGLILFLAFVVFQDHLEIGLESIPFEDLAFDATRRGGLWIVRIEKTLKLAETLSRSTSSLWEDDVTQFGEPLAAHMALLDVEFVPYYTRLLRLWDQGHQVHMGGAVVEIVNKHGVRAETEELILCYTEWTGIDDLGLLELLHNSKGQ